MRNATTKGKSGDRIALTRADGSGAAFGFARKGPYPHDAFHFFVERELGMARGFWGLVAGGMAPAAVQDLARAGGHASASRAKVPDAAIIELIEAERLVGCFEAASWSGGAEDAGLMAMAEPAWANAHVPPPPGVAAIRRALGAFLDQWRALPEGGTREFDWTLADGETA
jgi:hypothetical protein